jgi:hypothetical protein
MRGKSKSTLQRPKPKPAPWQGKTQKIENQPDDFVSVARRLERDEDKARFEKKLGKIAKAKPAGPRE